MRNSSAMRIVLAFLLLLIPAGGARASDLLYALVTQDFTGFSVPSWIEIVDPSGFSTVDSFSIGSRGGHEPGRLSGPPEPVRGRQGQQRGGRVRTDRFSAR